MFGVIALHMRPVTQKGTSWVLSSEIQFYGLLDRTIQEETENVYMLGYPKTFTLPNRIKKAGTVMKRHKICDDVTLTSQRKLDNYLHPCTDVQAKCL